MKKKETKPRRVAAPRLSSAAKDAISTVVMASRILANEGVLDALGHVSLRNPDNPNAFFQARSLSLTR